MSSLLSLKIRFLYSSIQFSSRKQDKRPQRVLFAHFFSFSSIVQSEKDLFHHLLHSRGIPQLEHLRSLHLVLLTLNHMTFTQLITLSSFEIHPPPTGFPQPTEGAPSSSSVSRPYSFIHNLKEMFKAWDLQTLSSLNQKLRASPLHLERKVLLELAPNTPWDMLHYVAGLLSF